MSSIKKIFVRERTKVEQGDKKPRFRIVAVAGVDIQFMVEHARKQEIEEIANHLEAEIVYLEIEKKDKE